ncbi:MAG: DUF6492 family protein [Candidatus Nanopelagicales bacterium]|nr:DUF6492 family protein [Candidatus Nanopelagicales bacterium]MCF8536788.1 DUF6492 family protein [Candidatus Nanopelagicales bacterium]MCF8541773.1 DUF6492 family protein [Candidatus Nanopelagicales bacterium]MCF8556186.1 DUF6492 family protein [Candidatus Nanopelagicales bacterium]
MEPVSLLLKSFRGDHAYAVRLVESFHEFNVDGLRLHVVVPHEDVELFAPLAGVTVDVIDESEFAPHLVQEPVAGLRAGYINQEIVKLAFWELELTENYFCVDSDAVFIRQFTASDFMFDDRTPFTVLVEDKELAVEPRYYREYWTVREAAIRRIQQEVDYEDPVIRTCHGHQVFSSAVLRSLKTDFLDPRGWDYADALAVAPYEFSWYNMWLQKTHLIDIHGREPYAKVFHHEGHHLEYVLRGIRPKDIARGYLLLVMNSNYSRDLGIIDPGATKPETLSHYLSYGEVAAVLRSKAKDTWRRRVTRRQA